MASERLKRQIDRLLDEVETAVSQLDWDLVRDRGRAVLALDPDNPDALSFLSAADRALEEPDSAEPSQVPPGDTIAVPLNQQPMVFANGRYQVQRLLGEGGKKRVYLAHDTLLDREVAFALIRTEGLDDIAKARITREAQAMGRLGSHPHIVTVFDLGEDGDQPYMVTELMGGGDVEGMIERAPNRRLPIAQAISISQQVCRGLQYAHSMGVVHRDLKPGNVWLTNDGTAKIGDLGLAVVLDRSRLTQTAMIVGTVSYMPPEQAMGGEVSPKSDLYSLGAMLYEMVTGRPPFVGEDSMAVIGQHINTPPVAPTWHNPQCPRQLEALILRLLAKDPSERPESAAVVLEALEAIDLSDAAAAAIGDTAPRDEPPPQDLLATYEFVGMQREMRDLRAALEDSLSGRGRLIMLTGDTGIGKTRVAQELATYAGLRGAQVLWGRCYREQGTPPYWPWIQAIRSYVQGRDEEQLRSELGAGAADIAELVTEVRERLPELTSPPPLASADQARFRLFDSISNFLKAASRQQPLVVILDDLHWADQPTLSLLQFVARELRGTRLLLLGTYQDVQVSLRHPLSQDLGELARERLFQRVPLRGLSQEEVAYFIQIVSGSTPAPGLVEAVFRQTEGNPFFVTEVARLLVQEGALSGEAARDGRRWSVRIPQGVREVIGQRLDPLSEGCRQALTVAAVIGREFSLELLGRLVEDMPSNRLLEVMEEGLSARVIDEIPMEVGRYRFAHALIRDTLLEEMSNTRKVRLHAVISEVLEQLYGRDSQDHAAEIAQHLAEAVTVTGSERLVRYSLMAGERALETHAPDEALDYFQRALEAKHGQSGAGGSERDMDEETAALMFGIGRSQLATLERHEMREAVSSLSQALDFYVQGRDVVKAVAVGEYPLPPLPGQRVGVTQLVARALAMIPPDSHEAGGLLSRYGRVIGVEEGDYEGAQETAGRALAIAQREGDLQLEMRSLADSAFVDIFHLHFEKSLEQSRRVIDLARRLNQVDGEMHGHLYAASCLMFTGDREGARLHAAASLALAERLRDRFWLSSALSLNLAVSRLQGDWAVGRTFSERGLTAAPRDPRILGGRTMLEYEVGEFGDGEGYLERLLETMRQAVTGPNYEHTYAATVIPFVARITGDFDRLPVAEQAANAVLSSPSASPYLAVRARIALGMVSVLRSDADAAQEQYEALETVQGTQVAAGGIICTDRLQGLLADTMGRTDDATGHFEDALGFCLRAGYRPEYAWTASDYADMLLQRNAPGDRGKSISLLDEALTIASELGMAPLEERVKRHGLHTERLAMTDNQTAARAIASVTTIEGPSLRPQAGPDGTITLLFCDIEGFTALSQKLGEQETKNLLSAYGSIVRDQAQAHGGTEVRSIRDGLMISFPDASEALRCAVDTQRAFVGYNNAHPEEPVRVRMGLNYGEASEGDDDQLSNDLILAARIADQAQGGRIIIAAALKRITENDGEFEFDEGREVQLEGVSGPSLIFELQWQRQGDRPSDSIHYFG